MHRSIVCSQQTMRGWLLKSEKAGSVGRFANCAPRARRRQDTKKREPCSSLNHKSENIAVKPYDYWLTVRNFNACTAVVTPPS